MKTKTYFAFRIDAWDGAGNEIVEHLAGLDDHSMAVAAYWAAVAAKPKEKITLRQGARVMMKSCRNKSAAVLRSSREAVADPVANAIQFWAKHWSEWQDLNLRPPRPERGYLPTAPRKSSNFRDVRRRLFTFGCCVSVPVTVPGERAASARQIVGMVMTIAVHQRFDSHSKETRGLPRVSAGLHQPRCRRVPQDMRRYIGVQPSILDHSTECLFDR